jgi:phosphate:Na+ symporter
VGEFLNLIVAAIKNEDKDIMHQAQQLEDDIDRMREEMRSNYIMRLQSGLCTVDPGLILVDMLTSLRKSGTSATTLLKPLRA